MIHLLVESDLSILLELELSSVLVHRILLSVLLKLTLLNSINLIWGPLEVHALTFDGLEIWACSVVQSKLWFHLILLTVPRRGETPLDILDIL